MDLGFRNRARWLPPTRNLVVDVCSEYLESAATTEQIMTAVQELLENLVKYSVGSRATFSFELLVVEGQPTARIATRNAALPAQLDGAVQVLSSVVAAADPVGLFEEMVAQSGERNGSGLGLARLRAEAGLLLAYGVEGNQLAILATRPVEARSDGGAHG